MNIKVTILISILILIPTFAFSEAELSKKSKYAGEEKREIKSLSATDIEELQNGKGWGLAKAAELNGVPGPAHLLEMKEEIDLNAEQVREIEDIYRKMKQEAVPLGLELIELERELNNHFANRTITDEILHQVLQKISDVHRQLRYAHLSTHLKTPDILHSEQIILYNKLRGYSPGDPCKNVPKGHDPVMWKKHNNCP